MNNTPFAKLVVTADEFAAVVRAAKEDGSDRVLIPTKGLELILRALDEAEQIGLDLPTENP